MTKRMLSVILALVMVFSILPMNTLAVDRDDSKNQVHVIVENTTFLDPVNDVKPAWTGTLVDTWVNLNQKSTMTGCVVAALNEVGATQTGGENNYFSEINGLSEFDGGSQSGWMGTLNDWFTNEGFTAYTVANGKLGAGDEIRIMYTCAYGADLGGTWGNNDTSLKNLVFSAGTLEPAFDSKTLEYTLTIPADVSSVVVTPTAANKNFQVHTKIGKTEYKRTAAVPVRDGTDLTVEVGTGLSMNEGATPTVYKVHVATPRTDVAKMYRETGDMLEKMAAENAPVVGSVGGEWAVIGLARSGRSVPAAYYDNVVSFVNGNINDKEQLNRNKSTENSRIILALTALGKDVTNVAGHNLLKGLSDMNYLKRQGNNGPIWALIAFDSHDYEIPTASSGVQVTRDGLIDYILSVQLEDGGWTLSNDSATTSDADMTGMALQALAPYYKKVGKVTTAVDKALAALSAMQLSNGGYDSWGTVNVESCAQVLVALNALGIDAQSDSRYIKSGKSILDAMAEFYVAGGGFRHAASQSGPDDMATEQSYYGLTATARLQNGQTSLYDMSDVQLEGQKFDLEGTSMLLGNSLQMNIYVSKTDLSSKTGAYAVVTKSYADGRGDLVVKIPAAQWSENNKSYKIPFTGIAAKEMADPVKVQVFAADGTALSTVRTDTIREYALRTLGNPKTADVLKTVIVDMLNYGAACQKHFQYNQNHLANAGAEAYQKFATKNVSAEDHRVKGDNFVGTTLKAENNLLMTFYFKNVTSRMNAKIRFTDHYNNDHSITIKGSDFRFKNDQVVIDVDQLVMADVKQPVTCEIRDASGRLVASVTDSVESYIARAAKDDVFTSILKFGTSALHYFHRNDA